MTSVPTSSYNTYSHLSSATISRTKAAVSNSTGQTATPVDGDSVNISPEGQLAARNLDTNSLRPSTVELPNYADPYRALSSAFGLDKISGIPVLLRSESLKLQAQAEVGEKSLDERISQALQNNGITLEKGETLNLTVNQKGEVQLGDGITDPERRGKIVAALNGNSGIGEELLLSQARREYLKSGSLTQDSTTWSIMKNAYGKQEGNEPLYGSAFDRNAAEEFELSFSYSDGAVVRDGVADPNRLFSNRMDTFAGLSQLLGFETPTSDMNTFLESLDAMIADEAGKLTTDLNAVIAKAGLGDVTKKITLAEDANGNIVIVGNIRADQKKELAKLINGDKELAERIKTQKARMDIAAELKQSLEDFPDTAKGKTESERQAIADEFYARKNGFDLGSEKLASARKQLLKDYLSKNGGIDLGGIASKFDQATESNQLILRDANGNEKSSDALQSLLAGIPGLDTELSALLGGSNSVTTSAIGEAIKTGDSGDENSRGTTALLSMHRGFLSEATDEKPNFDERVRKLRGWINELANTWNEKVAGNDDSMKISNYSVRFDDHGRIKIEGLEVQGGDPEQAIKAKQFMQKQVAGFREYAEELAGEILGAHDEEHGDVQEFKHEITFGTGLTGDWKVVSPDADAAAMKELQTVGNEIGKAFNEFFGSKFKFEDPFAIRFDSEGKLSLLDSNLDDAKTTSVKNVLKMLNERLASDDPLNDDNFETMIPAALKGVMEKLLDLKEIQDKFHEPALKEAGVVFTVVPLRK